MVRAVRLEENPSGSYYNLSEGISDSISSVITGISEASHESDFSFSPNPASKRITIHSGNLQHNLLEILNSEGKILFSQTVNQTMQSIDVSSLSAGIYFVKWNGRVKKLAIQ